MANLLSIKSYCTFLVIFLIIIAGTVYKDQIPYYTTFSNGKSLTRPYAKKLMEQHEKFSKITILPHNHVIESAFFTKYGVDELIASGIREGIWVKSSRSTYAVALSHYGEEYFKLDEENDTINGFVLNDRSKRKIVEITGIADGPKLIGEGIREVQFTWEYDLPEVVERYFELGKIFQGAALMRLYDNGWRVEKIELE